MGLKGGKMKQKFPQICLGMHKHDVLKLLGDCDSQTVNNDIEVLTWSSNEFKGIFRGGFRERAIIIQFKNNVIVSFEGKNINQPIW